MRKSLTQLNLPRYCSELGVPLTSCPPFLFLMMGVVVISAILGTYVVAQRYAEPEIAVLIVLALAAFLLVVGYLIIGAFEKLADSRSRERTQAAELFALKDQFVFLAAHELRSPATAIKWAVESLEAQPPDMVTSNRELVAMIMQNTMRLLGLVRDLLETARIESKALRITLQPTALSGVIGEAISEVREQAHSRDVELVSEVPESTPRVSADPLRVKEVMHHLLSNAIKFSELGGTVKITAESDEKTVAINVIDNGAGIRTEDREHIFEKFWHAADGRVSPEHSGLGLFITKQLMQLMGGSVRFVSEQGKGTTFTVEFKRVEG